MTTPRDRSIYQIAWALLNDEFKPGGDDYKGVSKDIHNASLEAGWRLLESERLVTQDELDNLRRWKAEATAVIAEWERVWEACGSPGPLGGRKSENVLRVLKEDGVI